MDSSEYERSKCTLAQMSNYLAAYSKERESLIAQNMELKRLLKQSEEKNKEAEATNAAVVQWKQREHELFKSIEDVKRRFEEFKNFNPQITLPVENDGSSNELVENKKNQSNESENPEATSTKIDANEGESNETTNYPEASSTQHETHYDDKPDEEPNLPETTLELSNDKVMINTKIPTRPKRKRKVSKKKRKHSYSSASDDDIETNSSFASYYTSKKSLLICKICESENESISCFENSAALNDHLTQVHPNNVDSFYFRCPYRDIDNCTRYFACKKGVVSHTRQSHSKAKSKPLTCSICHEEFCSYRLFEKHRKFHDGRGLTSSTNLNETTDAVPVPPTCDEETSHREILSTEYEHEEPTSSEKISEPNKKTSAESETNHSEMTTSIHDIPSSVSQRARPPEISDQSHINGDAVVDLQILQQIKRENLLDDPLNCYCGFFSLDGNDMASHLENCGRKTAYSNAETAAQYLARKQSSANNKSVLKIAEVVLKESPYDENANSNNTDFKVTVLNCNQFLTSRQNIKDNDAEVIVEVIEISDNE